MATVYLAIQESLGREVALKLLSPALASDPVASERFLREGRIAAKLLHRNIVGIYDVGVHQGQPYIAMEYMPGGTVSVQSAQAPDVALSIVRDIALALDHAHREGVVHRDLKPENILRRADGSYALSDFGIAHAGDAMTTLTQEGMVIGTPHYMSPEQVKAQPLDGRSDLYGLGVVLYQLLTGSLPYEGSEDTPVGMQHAQAPLPVLPVHLSRYQTLIDALMAKSAAARPADGAAVVRRIEELQSKPGTGADTRVLPAAPANSGQRGRRKAAALILALLVLGLAGLWFAHSDRKPSSEPAMASAPAAKSEFPTGIVVLPFANLGEDAQDGLFADGLTEEIINTLAQLQGLRVIGRTSSFYYKGRDVDVRSIAKELDVSHLIEGSVRRQGDTLRVMAQLVSADTGAQVWSQRFERASDNIFAVQDEIASAVAGQFKLAAPMATDPGEMLDPAAQREYLEALARARIDPFATVSQQPRETYLVPLRDFVAAHPDFRPAYWQLGWSSLILMQSNGVAERDSIRASIQALADEARQRWPSALEGRALSLLAQTLRNDMDVEGYRMVLNQIRQLADEHPNVAGLQIQASLAASEVDAFDVGIRYAERYVALEPKDLMGYLGLSAQLDAIGQYAEAENAIKRGLISGIPASLVYTTIANLAARRGDLKGTLDAVEHCLEVAQERRCLESLASIYRTFRQPHLADEVNLLSRPEVWQKYTELREQVHVGGYQAALKWLNEQDPTAIAALTPYMDSTLPAAAMLSGEYAAALDRYRKLLVEATALHENLLVTSARVDSRIQAAIALHKLGHKGAMLRT